MLKTIITKNTKILAYIFLTVLQHFLITIVALTFRQRFQKHMKSLLATPFYARIFKFAMLFDYTKSWLLNADKIIAKSHLIPFS